MNTVITIMNSVSLALLVIGVISIIQCILNELDHNR